MPSCLECLAPAHAVGYCPELHTLCHSSRDVKAEELLQLPKLTTLRDNIRFAADITCSFVVGLQPLSCLQHIHLSKQATFTCHQVIIKCCTSGISLQVHTLSPTVVCLDVPCLKGFRGICSRYYAGKYGTFQEMSLLLHLQSFSVMIQDYPTLLSLSQDLSRLTALHTIELRKSSTNREYTPLIRESRVRHIALERAQCFPLSLYHFLV